jgi:hypothetical protein
MAEVFKTNVQEAEVAEKIVRLLYTHFPARKINFDLEDCDKILRIDAPVNYADKVIETLKSNGIWCEELL